MKLNAAGHAQKSKYIVSGIFVLLLALIINLGLNTNLAVRYYSISSPKIRVTTKIAFLSDLHSVISQKNEVKLFDVLANEKPTLVLLGGDIIDNRNPSEPAFNLISKLVENYSVVYVTGNHEIWSGQVEIWKSALAGMGVEVIDGNLSSQIAFQSGIQICGVDDPEIGRTDWFEALHACSEAYSEEDFKILLSHRPEPVSDAYQGLGIDLVLAGHTHGGQWRIPLTNQGVAAPSQGIFPKYSGGLYEQNSLQMLVNRGLVPDFRSLPRLFNPPEMLIITLLPDKLSCWYLTQTLGI